MHEIEYRLTENGCIGFLPSWEEVEFDSFEDYLKAYKAEENEIVEELERLYMHNTFPDYSEHHWIA